jgi:hypothetical protein
VGRERACGYAAKANALCKKVNFCHMSQFQNTRGGGELDAHGVEKHLRLSSPQKGGKKQLFLLDCFFI